MGIKLRPWRVPDAASLQALADDLDVARWMTEAFQHPYTMSDAQDWLSRATAQDTPHFFAIERDGILVGGAGIEPCDGSHRGVAIVGYWLGRNYWGRGIASGGAHPR